MNKKFDNLKRCRHCGAELRCGTRLAGSNHIETLEYRCGYSITFFGDGSRPEISEKECIVSKRIDMYNDLV